MSPSRRIGVSLLFTLMLLIASIPSASAAPAASSTHQVVRETVTWTLTPAQCPDVQATVTGTGERLMVIDTTTNSDGSTRILVNDLVKGTASDITGTYKFLYKNHNVEDQPVSGPYQVSMEDTFELHGSGTARISVGFNWRWTYAPGDTSWPPTNLEVISQRGNPLQCDPI